MARFDVYAGPDGALLLNVRSDQFDNLRRLILVPMLPLSGAPERIAGINPVVTCLGEDYAVMTQFIASAPRTEFRQPVTNLANAWDDITRALDLLFTGF